MLPMASFSRKTALATILPLFAISWITGRADPDITSDFLVPENLKASDINGSFFTFTGFRGFLDSKTTSFKVTEASKAVFPAVDGQSVSLAVLQFPPGGINPPHFHPRSSEAIFVVSGTLEYGYVDTTANRLYSGTFKAGSLFIFQKGFVHYQHNPDKTSGATAISAYGSANPGTSFVPSTLFATGVEDAVLAKSFNTDVATIQKIKAGFSTDA